MRYPAAWLRFCVAATLLAVSVSAQSAVNYRVDSVAGSSRVGDGNLALQAQLAAAEGIAVDAAGNVYITDSTDHRIRKVSNFGVISTYGGNGHSGYSGDAGPALDSQWSAPYGVALDASGNLFVADFGNARVRRIAPGGQVLTVAGGGAQALPGEGSQALAARFAGPRNVALDGQGNLYISDYSDHLVYRVTPSGQITTIAGTGSSGYNGDGPALSTRLSFPAGLAVDGQGALYIADSGNKLVRKLLNGLLTTVAGGASQTIPLGVPTGVAVDPAGNLYVADSQLNRVFRLTPNGAIHTLAGADPPLDAPVRDVALDKSGAVYISTGRRVMKVAGAAPPIAIAGDGTFGTPLDQVDATLSPLSSPIGIALDEAGNLYVAEEGSQRVRRIDRNGIIQTIAGGGSGPSLGDGGPATSGRLMDPVAVVADSFQGVRIADYLGNRIRGVLPSGILFTQAGNGEAGFRGDQGPAQSSQVNRPRGLALDRQGNLYIADSMNHRIRCVRSNGFIETVAGNGVRGYYGDGGPGARAHLNTPLGVAVDSQGNLFIADSGNHVIRKLNPIGILSTVAGAGARGFSGDGGPAALAFFHSPSAVAADAQGNLFIADTFNHRIRRVGAGGIVTTIAGVGAAGFSGDGGPALQARFRSPSGLAVDEAGNLYVADLDNHRIRKLTPAALVEPPPALAMDLVVMNAASFRSGPVAPGQIISIFGAGIGPAQAAHAKLNAAGVLNSSLAGVQVRFDGVPAPLLFVQQEQVNAQVPYGVAVRMQTVVEVLYDGQLRGRLTVPVAPAAPALFTLQHGVGPAVAVNEDGSLNGAANPALRGSLVTLYATGEGQTAPGGVDGMPAKVPLPRPLLPARVWVGSREADVLYAGPAPGFVGLTQINLRLPGLFSPPGLQSLSLQVGGQMSPFGVTIEIQ
ncbi:MAG: hypothetical protein JJE04_23750 [Acidobacteriia bacterium]|nr:hypothetical protein [Terriglobia bacterium]